MGNFAALGAIGEREGTSTVHAGAGRRDLNRLQEIFDALPDVGAHRRANPPGRLG
jgi:hypothetical protein